MARNLQELRASNVISPVLAEAVQQRTFETSDPDPLVRRKKRADHLAKLRQHMPLGGQHVPDVDERDIVVQARDGHGIPVRVYMPSASSQTGSSRPLILMFHEGGFSAGDWTDEEMNCRLFCKEFEAVCANVDYR